MASRDPKDLCLLLQWAWPLVKAEYEKRFPDRELFLICTHRPIEEQKIIYAQNKPGHILTRCDGVKNLSRHNYLPSHALDAGVKVKGKVVWEDKYYEPLGKVLVALGLEKRIRWGGWWVSFRDRPHLETIWPKDSKA
jgi:peptidoglycan LD-endopeptidase CwlK